MIFDLAENFTNYSWDLLASFGDNVKSTGPPRGGGATEPDRSSLQNLRKIQKFISQRQ